MSTILTIGIDPGFHGAIVALDQHRRCLLSWAADDKVRADTVPGYYLGESPDVVDIVAQLRALAVDATIARIVLESPFAPGRIGTKAALKIGNGYGHLRAALLIAGFPLDVVTPAKWSVAMLGKPPKGGWGGKKKQAAIDVVKARLPSVPLVRPGCRVPHDGIADAACMAAWGMGL